MDIPRQFFRYLPIYPEIEDWGVRVLDAGCTHVPPGTVYPAPGHPDDHHFTWEEGRTLADYTIVYITSGHGVFESSSCGQIELHAGHIFILFPGEWHRYRPSLDTGWDEYWIECEGPLIEETMRRAGFQPSRSVIDVGHDDGLLGTFREILSTILAEPPGYQAVIGLQSLVIVSRIRSLMLQSTSGGCTAEQKMIRHSIHLMLESLTTGIEWEDLSRKLGVSYSTFRRTFRKVTGISPGNYLIEMKIKRARQLLADPARTVQEVSDLLGFDSPSYFSNLFKSRTGVPPSACRKTSGKV